MGFAVEEGGPKNKLIAFSFFFSFSQKPGDTITAT